MERPAILSALLVKDRIIRFNLQMLETLQREIRADVEEVNMLAEACLCQEEAEKYKSLLPKVEQELLSLISDAIEHLYDLYEVFNFDVTFLANLPEELAREVEHLNAVCLINSKLEQIHDLLEEIVLFGEHSHKLSAVLTPFRVYRELLKYSMDFNRRLEEINLQRTG